MQEKLKTMIRTDLDKNTKKNLFINLAAVCVALGMTFYFSERMWFEKGELILSAAVLVIVVLSLIGYTVLKWKLCTFAFVFILSMGGASAFIQPIFNTPDEHAHFARAELVSRGHLIMDPAEQHYETIQSFYDLQDNKGIAYTQSDVKGKRIDQTSAETTNVAASNFTFLYIPQGFGMLAAKVLRLDVIWLLWLGRLMNLLCYAFLVYFALKLAPTLQFVLLFAAALPMSIQQAAALGTDAMINGLSFLLIGYFLHLYCKDGMASRREVLLFMGIGFLLTMAKITDIFLAGLFLLIPQSRFGDKKKEIAVKSLVIGSTILVGALCYYYYSTFAPCLELKKYLDVIHADSKGQIQYILGNPSVWLKNFGTSLIYQMENYIKMLSSFGAFTYDYTILTPVAVFMYSKICFQEQGVSLNRLDKFLVLLMLMGVICFTSLAMYISWTPVGAVQTEGVQGRYFIPIIMLASLLFVSSEKNTRERENHMTDLAVINYMAGAMLIVTAVRYY